MMMMKYEVREQFENTNGRRFVYFAWLGDFYFVFYFSIFYLFFDIRNYELDR